MNVKGTRRLMMGLTAALLALGLVACGALESGTETEYPVPGEEETGPGAVVTADSNELTEEPAKGDEEGLEVLGGGFEWRRVGGIAGFCDVVTVNAGTATVATCRSDPPEVLADLTLAASQSQQVLTWLEELAPFKHKQSDGATADGMMVTLTFVGQGDGEATADDIAAMEALAMALLGSVPNR